MHDLWMGDFRSRKSRLGDRGFFATDGRLVPEGLGPEDSKWGKVGVWRQGSVSFPLPATKEFFCFSRIPLQRSSQPKASPSRYHALYLETRSLPIFPHSLQIQSVPCVAPKH